ncbi:hypothetical protein AB0B89_14420 [Sphaerisporangium sp. NPDC049002]|uniref:hypothetical protein n=1 Tax=unclassified Sphaerisporangium TaxID=2630420 RepID=UPI0034047B64
MRPSRRGEGRRRRGAARLSRALAAMLTLVVTATLLHGVPASAFAEPEVPDPDAINQQLHSISLSMKDPHYYRDVILGLVLASRSQTAPGKSEAEVAAEFQGLSDYLDQQLKDVGKSPWENKVAVLTTINRAVAGDPRLAPAAAALNKTFAGFSATPGHEYDNWQNAVAASQSLGDSASLALEALNQASAKAVRGMGSTLGDGNAYVKIWDARVGDPSGLSAGATTDELVAKSPLRDVVNFNAIWAYGKDDPRYKEEILKQFEQLIKQANWEVKNAVVSIDDLQLKYEGAYKWSSTAPNAPDVVKERVKKEAEARQKVISGVDVGISILSKLVGVADPKLATRIEIVGKAAVKIANAINEYLPKIAAMGAIEAIFSAGTVAFTGNIIGAISSLLPLFRAGSPSPEQMMLEQIGKLRQEVADLHKAMDEQFARVNKNLNVIYEGLLNRFDEVIKLQQASAAQLTAIQGQLQGIQQSVDVWAAEIIKSLQNVQLKDARAGMNAYIGYEQTHSQPIPTFEEYAHVVNDLHFAAVTQAREEPFVPSPTSYQQHAAGPVAVVDAYGSSGGATGFLSWYGKQNYGWPQQPSSSPNLAAWLTMANGFTRLASENQGYAKRVNTQRTSDIVAAGLDIDKAARQLSEPLNPPAADGTYTNALFKGLVRDYKNAVAALSDKLVPLQKEYTDEKGYKLFGTADQALPAGKSPATPGTVSTCPELPNKTKDIETPGVVSLAQMPNPIVLANYALPEADRPALSLCYQGWLTNQGGRGDGQILEQWADLAVTVKMRLTWPDGTVQTFRTWTQTQPLGVICRTRMGTPLPGDPTVYFCNDLKYYLGAWVSGGYKQVFDMKATFTSDDAVLTAARDKVARFLSGRQKAYYDRVVAELTTPGKPLSDANAQVTKSMRLLQAFTETGWATALRQDEIMQLLLGGVERLPSDLGGDPLITDVFRRAQENYAGCAPVGGHGSACSSRVSFDPFVGQSHEWLIDCLSWYDKSRLPVELWTGDPLANTVLGFSRHAADTLLSRYEKHSKELAGGVYAEGVPEVKNVLGVLESFDAVLRVPTT